jgi:selenophosphate synthase
LIHPKKILTNAKAKVGDKLVLTKALGTGIVATALKGGMASEEAVRQIVESMVTLNRTASEWMKEFGAHACTDITGFSFLGHALEMATASQVGMVIQSVSIFEALGMRSRFGYWRRPFKPSIFLLSSEADMTSPSVWTFFTILRPLVDS